MKRGVCRDCSFWEQRLYDRGECRIAMPVYVPPSQHDQLGPGRAFPLTIGTDWCLHFMQRPEDKDKP